MKNVCLNLQFCLNHMNLVESGVWVGSGGAIRGVIANGHIDLTLLKVW